MYNGNVYDKGIFRDLVLNIKMSHQARFIIRIQI